MIDINTISSETTTMLMGAGAVLLVGYFMLLFVKDNRKGTKADDQAASNSKDLVPRQKSSYFFNWMSRCFGQAKEFVLCSQMQIRRVALGADARVSPEMESVGVRNYKFDKLYFLMAVYLLWRYYQRAVTDEQILVPYTLLDSRVS